LGRFTAYGKAKLARARLKCFIEELLTRPAIKRTALGELLAASEEGAALSKDEIADTVLTFLLAGQLTTKDAIPNLVIDLVENKQLVERIRAEADKGFTSIEQDSVTLRFICESLKRHPPAGAFRRSCLTRDIDLGAAGIVPKGVSMACLLSQEEHLAPSISVDDPAYDDKQVFFDRLHTVFGGKQPHSCAGKHIALLEMQIFLRELCAKYTIDRLDVVFQSKMGMAGWKDDLPIRLSHKS
jgi:cytochrome P450